MSYSDIRTYFQGRVEGFKSDFKEWKDALVFEDTNNIPTTLLDSRYHIEFNSLASSPASDKIVEDSWQVNLSLFKNGANKPQDALDELLDDAFCIKSSIIDPRNVEAHKVANNSFIEAAELVSLTPGAIELSNDNIVKVLMQFNVRLYASNLLQN
jgi:hypothetical protein